MSEVKKEKYQIDMCSGSVLKKLVLFCFPLMCSGMLQLLFNAADVIVVGRFAGDEPLAAVGATSSLINLFTNIFIGLSVGSNVLTARFLGASNKGEIEKTVHTSVALALVSGGVLAVVGFVVSPLLLGWMSTPETVLPLATLYLRIYFLGMPAMMLYNFGSAILRAIGDTRRPLYYLMAAGVLNVVLNLLFVIIFKMSVAGVALATVISQILSAFLIIRCLTREDGEIRLNLRRIKIDRTTLFKILQIGLPAGVQGTLFSLSNVFIQSSVNLFGDIVVAGNSAAGNLEGFVYIAMNSVYQGTISFVSQNVGAMKFKRVPRVVLTAQILVIAVGLVMGNAIVIFGKFFLGLYTDNPAVVEAGMVRLLYICVLYALCGMMEVMVGALRGIGYSVMPMIVSLIGACALRLVWLATVFQIEAFHCIETIYVSYPISWFLTLIAHIICFLIVWRRFVRQWKEQDKIIA
ncbi:MAG: MATE family efflux transporter [Lachnospiraceae bacterium]|nr:MATE family efflux transporter [Lachnospiraceae bacterium]